MLEIEVLLTKLRDDIEASYKAKGLMASGNFAKELKLVVGGNNAKITAPSAGSTVTGESITVKGSYWATASVKEVRVSLCTLDAKGLFAGHNPKNVASRKILLEKLGFAYVGDVFYPPTGMNHPSYSYRPDPK